MRSGRVPDIVRTTGGATVVNARKVAERYVEKNVDTSRVAREDKEYIETLCAHLMTYAARADLYFEVQDDGAHNYTIFIANWNGRLVFTDFVETFHMEDSDPLYQNILSSCGNFATGQVEIMVKKRGIVSSMHAKHKKALETPYAKPSKPPVLHSKGPVHRGSSSVYAKRATRLPVQRDAAGPRTPHARTRPHAPNLYRPRGDGRGRGRKMY